MAEAGEKSRSPFGKLLAWVGVAVALISFGTAVHGLLQAQGDLRERGRVVSEQLAAGRQQQAAGYYPAAWDSIAAASVLAANDGLFAKLLGGLSRQRQDIRTAQEDLAMEWIRAARATEGQTFAELADKLVNVLASGASTASGSRKADLLAHLGWAYFLKSRSGDANVHPEVPYREAVAVDATNPYGNVFWGHWILWSRGPVAEAQERFEAALATRRAREDVRHFQLAALTNLHSAATEAAWLKVIEEMQRNGEKFEPSTIRDLYGQYYFALNDPSLLQRMLAVVPAQTQLALQEMLLQSADLDVPQKEVMQGVVALTQEAAGKPADALATWRELQRQTGPDPHSTLAARAKSQIARLSKETKRAK